jgi:hypothetical protein
MKAPGKQFKLDLRPGICETLVIVTRCPIVAAAGLALLFASSLNSSAQSAAARDPSPTSIAVAAPVATPTPTRHIASEGTYFLLELVSIQTSSGVIGDPPGTQVTFIKRENSGMRVSDAEHRVFTVKASQLTNDADLAAHLKKIDSDKQKQIQQRLSEQRATYEAQTDERLAAAAAAQESIQKQGASTPAAQNPGDHWQPKGTRLDRGNADENPLERGPYSATDAKRYHDKEGREYWIDIFGRRHYVH